MNNKVKIIYHPNYSFDYHTAECECPSRTTSIIRYLPKSYEVITPTSCTEDDIQLCHTKELFQKEKESDIQRYEVACLAVGGAILTSELAMEGYISFGIIRPPGHHASSDSNWGFCFFNNMAIAIQRLLHNGLINSAVILDIDLHFGDGTNNIFNENRDVHVLNIQSSTPDEFITEIKESLAEIKKADIIGISAGFDQYIKDWGANLTTDNYRTIGAIAKDFAIKKTNGKIFALLEGGYYISDLGKNVEALIQGMSI